MPLVELLKPYLPGAIRAPLAAGAAYWRGRRVVRAYRSHYLHARRVYPASVGPPTTSSHNLADIGVRVLPSNTGTDVIALPGGYQELVRTISDGVRARFERSAGLTFFPRLPDGPVPELTKDIAAVSQGDVIIMRLVEPSLVRGVIELSRAIVEEIERRIYGSFAVVDRLFIYRSPVSRQRPRASWLWHYDNYPREILKVMVYLSDVTEGCAPFEYLRHNASGEAMRGRPVAPGYGDGRYGSDTIAALAARGYSPATVTGPPGTMAIFNTNVVHRANLAERGHRDVLVLQVRPASASGYGVVDPRWTGSFQHSGFNLDPADLRVR